MNEIEILKSEAWTKLYIHPRFTKGTLEAIKDFGSVNADGNTSLSYGVLFDKTANTLEALNGTLRAARRQRKVVFDGELLMMPKDKDVQVILLEE